MKRLFRSLCLISLLAAQAGAQTPGVTGTWSGELKTPGGSLQLALHVTGAEGKLTAKLDSVTQGAYGLAVDEITLENRVLRFSMRMLGASFEGMLAEDGSAIDGKFTQGGLAMPLRLSRGAVAPPKRPQEPQPPLPYKSEEVIFPSAGGNVRLAGTLTLPAGKPPFAAAILLSGSGPQDRDESIMGHKPFLVLSDHLTRQGIAVLRYDDRGFGKSTGQFAAATSQDFAVDAEAALEFLKQRPEIDPRRIGLIGHSEGGIVAPMVAARRAETAFVVLLAGTGVTGEQVMLSQAEAMAKAAGAPPQAIEQNAAMQKRIFALMKEESDPQKLAEKLAGVLPAGPQGDAQIRQLTSPWFRFFLTYDPALALEKTKCPVLALNGELDLQVVSALNLPPIEAALRKGGNKDVRIERLPGLNHLFQPAKTGLVNEYAQIEETMSPKVLDLIANWIRERAAR